jgi:hypothetical protein
LKAYIVKHCKGTLVVLIYLSLWCFWPWFVSQGSTKVGCINAGDKPPAAAQEKVADHLDKLGQLGDSYGSLTALLSGVGLFFIIKTFQQQQSQIDQQKQQFDKAQEYAKVESKRHQTLLFYNLATSTEVLRQLSVALTWTKQIRSPDVTQFPFDISLPKAVSSPATLTDKAWIGNYADSTIDETVNKFLCLVSLSDLCNDAVQLLGRDLVDKAFFCQLLRERLLRIVALFETVDFGKHKEDTSADRYDLNNKYLEPAMRLKALLVSYKSAQSTEQQTPT